MACGDNVLFTPVARIMAAFLNIAARLIVEAGRNIPLRANDSSTTLYRLPIALTDCEIKCNEILGARFKTSDH
jgi:hypothetical protein